MASLQARHARKCATNRPWTPFAKDKMRGCDCNPSYYVVVRAGTKLHRERVGKDRQLAERALRKIGTTVDDGAYVPQKQIVFRTWADGWLKGLERESSTVRSYGSTVEFAKRAFGDRTVRSLGVEEIKRLLQLMRSEGLSDSTRAKHLRVLGACLESAIVAGYAARNPVRLLPKAEKPRPRKRESAYFANDEIPPLFAKLEDDVYRVAYLLGLKTGMRLGELCALAWSDVDLIEAVIRVRWSWTDSERRAPKNHERRTVHLAPDVVEMLGAWWGDLGSPTDDVLVLPGGTKSGYLSSDMLRRNLYAAMDRAEIPRVGATGEPRTFHSLRHTYAKRALESGRQITWLSRHLGHSSTDITTECYGHFEPTERKRQAELMEGVFGV